MPKMKTHKGAAKRFKVTGSGKITRDQAFMNHNFEQKPAKRKRRLTGRTSNRSPSGRITNRPALVRCAVFRVVGE